jgi:hypothetical protein
MAKASHVDRALDLFADVLTRKKNVVGVGKVPAEEAAGEWRLAVYVKKKVPEDELAAADLVPKTLELPGSGQKVEVKTKVIEQGIVSLEDMPGLETV